MFVQLVLFVLIWSNIELYSYRHLVSEGYESVGGMATLDPATGWRIKSQMGGSNAEGLLNPEVKHPRPPNEFRIMCLGGSVTMGWGVGRTQSYPRVLETLLREREPAGVDIHVINGGIAGFGTAQCARLLGELAPRYEPAVVTAMCGYNEQNTWAFEGVAHDSAWSGRGLALRSLLYRSPTYRYLWRKLLRPPIPASSNPQTLVQTSISNLVYLNEYTKSHQCHLLLVFEGLNRDWAAQHPDQKPHPRSASDHRALLVAYEQLSREANLPLLNLDALLHQHFAREDEIFLDECHLTVEANKVAAKAIADKLASLGWVPQR